jgi:hypothetical protein
MSKTGTRRVLNMWVGDVVSEALNGESGRLWAHAAATGVDGGGEGTRVGELKGDRVTSVVPWSRRASRKKTGRRASARGKLRAAGCI